MINHSASKPIWLIPDDKIVKELKYACEKVYQCYMKYFSYGDTSSIYFKLSQATGGGVFDFDNWTKHDVELMLTGLYRNSRMVWSDVNPDWTFSDSYKPSFVNFLKMVCVMMWARRVFLAPLDLTMPSKIDWVYDDICEMFAFVSPLSKIRSLHANSKLEGGYYEFDDNGRRATLWSRLLLSTSFYDVDEFDPKDFHALFQLSYGARDLPLQGYDTTSFLRAIYDENEEAMELLSFIEQSMTVEKLRKLEETRARRAANDALRQRVKGSSRRVRVDYGPSIEICIAFSKGSSDVSLRELIHGHFTAVRYSRLFQSDSQLYRYLDPKVSGFVDKLRVQHESFLVSKRYENDNSQNANLTILSSYASVYLPHFFLSRDGNLDEYPENFNQFKCFVYVTWDQQGVEKGFHFLKPPPLTLLGFLKLHVDIHGMGVDSHYARVKNFELYFSYIQEHRLQIADADSFSSTFNSSCFPRVARSYGTKKKALPRKYFAAFVSMLYSFEYLVMHLNFMAEGQAYGVTNGRLVKVTPKQLRFAGRWAGIWGTGKNVRVVDLSALNYCPIFYFDEKIYRFEYIPRFYNPSDFEVFVKTKPVRDSDLREAMDNGGGTRTAVERIAPNDVRVTLVMCETGLRQRHTIWLDLDKYDYKIDKSSKSMLTVLDIATDKAHGAWTAIVARHVVQILDNQRAWYESCSDPAYNEPLPYNGNPRSKFGMFRPLFRKYTGAPRSWTVYNKFPIFLLALKYFIEKQLGDDTDYELAYLKSEDGQLREFSDYSPEAGDDFTWEDLVSEYTPHGLRAAFITEALNFLPPSIVGSLFTAQTPELVLYYQIVDGIEIPGHREILADYLAKNLDGFSHDEAPEIADRIIKLNARLAMEIKENIPAAVQKFGLVSLQGVKEGKNGIDLLIAKSFTELAYNTTHICPFGNKCPVEVVNTYGNHQPCGICPYAIRGVMHLPAISAEKDKYKELMIGIVNKLNLYVGRGVKSQDVQSIENLNAEHDYYAREAFSLEVIEQELYKLYKSGAYESFIVQEKDELMSHFERVHVDGGDAIMKRLVDVLAWPDSTSPDLDLKFANVRTKLLMHDGNLEELLNVQKGNPASQLFSVIKSMVDSGRLDVMELVRLANEDPKPRVLDEEPDLIAQLKD